MRKGPAKMQIALGSTLPSHINCDILLNKGSGKPSVPMRLLDTSPQQTYS